MKQNNHRAIVGLNIRKLRVSKKMTQEQLGRAIGHHENYVQRIETGKHSPTIETLRRLARALNCSLSQLLEGVGPS